MKKAFTLMEVNLAIMIMAGGVLAILGLYSLGYRENRQSEEDVISAAYAEAVINPLVMALSDTNLTWSAFDQISNYPDDSGWGAYINSNGVPDTNPDAKARQVFNKVMSAVGKSNIAWPTDAAGGLKAGLVILRDENDPDVSERGSAIVKIGFRAAKKPTDLLAMPLYYTEVRFQGVINNASENEGSN